MEEQIYFNNVMTLRLIKKSGENAVFAHLINGEVQEYIVGKLCKFDGKSVTWAFGSYNLTKQQALRRLNK